MRSGVGWDPITEVRSLNCRSLQVNSLVSPDTLSPTASPGRLRSSSRHASSLLSSPVLRPTVSRTRSGAPGEDGPSDIPGNLTLSPTTCAGESNRSRGASPYAYEDHNRGRNATKRFSLAGVSTAIFEAISDRVRSVSHHAEDLHVPVGGRERSRDGRHSPDAKHKGTLMRVGEVLGLEAEETKEHGDGWKEFKPGDPFNTCQSHLAY